MESAIQLNCGYQTITSPAISSTIGIGKATAKFQMMNYNCSSTGLSCISRHQVTPALSQLVHCKGYSFSGIFSKRRKSTSIDAQMHLTGGKEALKSLLEMSQYLAIRSQPRMRLSYPELPEKLSTSDVQNLKKYALWLIKSGKPRKAVKTLMEEYEKHKQAEPEIADVLDLAIVEIHICLGQYNQAAERKCLQVDPEELIRSDSRIPLYKAIVHTILNDNEKAQQWWKQFLETVGDGGFSDVQISEE